MHVALQVEGIVGRVLGFVRFAFDDAGGERGNGRVLVGDRCRQRHSDQLFDLTAERHGVPGGQPELFHRPIVGDLIGRLTGGVGNPVTQPLT